MNARSRTLFAGLAIFIIAVGGSAVHLWWRTHQRSTSSVTTSTDGRASNSSSGLSPASMEYARAALQAYEALRLSLAQDRFEHVSPRAKEAHTVLQSGVDISSGPEKAFFEQASKAALEVARATTMEAARKQFAAFTQSILPLVELDPRLKQGLHLFRCPMANDDLWLQANEQLENPYMGQRMLACGTRAEWPASSTSPSSGHIGHEVTGASDRIAHFTCPMHPSVRQAHPGKCPVCGMDLTPVTEEEVRSGIVRIDESRRNRIGITTAHAVVAPMDLSIRALGRVTYDETALEDVTLKLDGFVHDLKVNATGQPVKKGDVLFFLYSPELYAAQQEFLNAIKSKSEVGASLGMAARKRLELWGMHKGQIDRLAERGTASERVPFVSPTTGYVLEKNVVEGAAVKAGERLFRIAPLSKVWVEANVYEQDLPQVKVGQPVRVSLPYLPGQVYEGKVAYIYPALEQATRTAKVRVELANEKFELKPDMFADVRFEVKGGPRLQIPDSAVVFTGPRRIVFVDLGEGKMKPQSVTLGMKGEGTYEVLDGLKPGDLIVTSGNFLIAAESRIRSSSDAVAPEGGHAGH